MKKKFLLEFAIFSHMVVKTFIFSSKKVFSGQKMHSAVQIQIEMATGSRNIDVTPNPSVDERQMIFKKLILK